MYTEFTVTVVLLSILLSVLRVNCDRSVVVQTANGPVKGIEQTTSLGKKFYAFRGVPYAETPITGQDPYTGEQVDRRFKAPEPLKRTWTENLEVHNYKDCCIPSTGLFQEISESSEDCLYLNIYVPAGCASRKTVLVYIHGGAFVGGEANDNAFGPDILLSEDVILITVQYRLGIFGFLNLGFGEYTGNMGLKDQQAALKYIYENIEQFSGKNDEILLFGESSGGSAVNYHMLNEESRKYFNRVYFFSSSAFSYLAMNTNNYVERMQQYSNKNSMEDLVEYLKTTGSDILVNCHMMETFDPTFISDWVPIIESAESPRAFMTQMPIEVYKSGKGPVIDTMVSFNSQARFFLKVWKEYISFYPELTVMTEPLLKDGQNEFKLHLPFKDFNENTYPEEYGLALKKLKKAYYSNSSNISAIKHSNVALLSDLNFVWSTVKASLLQAISNTNSPDEREHKNTFLFRFGMDTDINCFKLREDMKFDGAGHGEELCYIFHCHLLDILQLYQEHFKQKDGVYHSMIRMAKIITNFARTGNPTVEGDTPFKSCKSPTEMYCHEITNDPKSSVTTNIMEQIHYDTWQEIEESYEKLKAQP